MQKLFGHGGEEVTSFTFFCEVNADVLQIHIMKVEVSHAPLRPILLTNAVFMHIHVLYIL